VLEVILVSEMLFHGHGCMQIAAIYEPYGFSGFIEARANAMGTHERTRHELWK
jgi:hypothetical protein